MNDWLDEENMGIYLFKDDVLDQEELNDIKMQFCVSESDISDME